MRFHTRGLRLPSARRLAAGGAAAALVATLAPAGIAAAQDTYDRGIARACPPDAADAFSDDDGTAHEDSIDCVAHWEIAQGTGSGYNPSGTVNRAQMATYIAQEMIVAGYEFPQEPEDAFSDDDGTVHEPNINRLAAAGVVQGDEDGSYNPGRPVTRAAMATFVNQAVGAVTGTLPTSSEDYFTDDNGTTHEDSINALASNGIVQGDTSGDYVPAEHVRRAPMATFVARSADYLAEQGSWPEPTAISSAYTVSPAAPATLAFGQTRQYSVEVPDATPVNIALFAAGTVSAGGGSVTFQDTAAPAGVADLGDTDAAIVAVNGIRVDGTQQLDDHTARDGVLTFTVQSSTAADVVPVVWTDGQDGTANALDLGDADETVEAFGIGGRATFVANEAADGQSTPVVSGVDLDQTLFATTNGRTYRWATGDTFELEGTPSTQADFAKMLSAGDVLAVTYDRDGTSAFDITKDVTLVPSAPSATAVEGSTDDDTGDFVVVLVAPPAGNNPATTYTLQRQEVTNPANPTGSCDFAGDPADDGWEDVTAITDGTFAHTDGPLDAGCYVYRLQVTSPVQEAVDASDPSEPVAAGASIDDTRPTIDTATVTADNTPADDCADAEDTDSGTADACDEHTFELSENMSADIAAGWYRVSDGDGTIADIVCTDNPDKDANATCTYSNAQTLPTSAPATLTVTLDGAPTIVQAGDVPGLGYPVTIVSLSSEWQDTAGNAVTFEGSDRVLDVDES